MSRYGVLVLREFNNFALHFPTRQLMHVLPGSAIATQTIDVTDEPLSSASFSNETHVVEVVATAPCLFDIGGDPNVEPGKSGYLAANERVIYGVSPGQRIAIRVTPAELPH
jgi:hypothetical protein